MIARTTILVAGFLLCLQGTAAESWPSTNWIRATPEELGLDQAKLETARDYALSAGGSGYITRHGRLVMSWGDTKLRYDLKSSTKSFGSIALGLAITDGKVRLEDRARKLHPTLGTPPEENANSGWLDEITLLHLASQTAGFEKPGGYTRQLFRPGTMWDYSDSGPNWLAECLTLAYRRDLDELMFERIFTPLGITREDLVWRKNSYRPAQIEGAARREFGSGISANVDAMARVGLLMLRGGRWRDRQLLPADYVASSPRPIAAFAQLPVHTNSMKDGPDVPRHYGLLWWNNADGTLARVPRDAYWSWGLYDSLILVVPSLDLVVTRTGKSWPRKPDGQHYDPLRPFFEPIVASVLGGTGDPPVPSGDSPDGREGKSSNGSDATKRVSATPISVESPAPPVTKGGSNRVIERIEWSPPETIHRAAKGSDNWPLTWADDDALYGAYGDGNGFEPFTPEKLSLGLARIEGGPDDFRGTNLRSPSLEARGDGSKGKKASGLLCVKGVLYLWARNAGNSQLAWSSDHGRTWTWADWKFTRSFGCPTFVNYGRDYAGNRDGFAYVLSPDTDSAYSVADRFVLARVPVDQIRERTAYEFFAGPTANGSPTWTTNIGARRGVLERPGACYRPGVSFSAALKRFLLVHARPNERSRDTSGKIDVRFRGGLTVYEAPDPWGPWTNVFDTNEWDVGPGDSQSFPTKWMSADGLTLHIVFSGDDCFSVRKAKIIPAKQSAADL